MKSCIVHDKGERSYALSRDDPAADSDRACVNNDAAGAGAGGGASRVVVAADDDTTVSFDVGAGGADDDEDDEDCLFIGVASLAPTAATCWATS